SIRLISFRRHHGALFRGTQPEPIRRRDGLCRLSQNRHPAGRSGGEQLGTPRACGGDRSRAFVGHLGDASSRSRLGRARGGTMRRFASLVVLVAAFEAACGTQYSDPIRDPTAADATPPGFACSGESVLEFDGSRYGTITRLIQDDFTIEVWIKTDQ